MNTKALEVITFRIKVHTDSGDYTEAVKATEYIVSDGCLEFWRDIGAGGARFVKMYAPGFWMTVEIAE